VGVSDLLCVESKLTEAVKAALVEEVSSLGTVSVDVVVSLTTPELPTFEGLDGFDGFLKFHKQFRKSWIAWSYCSLVSKYLP